MSLLLKILALAALAAAATLTLFELYDNWYFKFWFNTPAYEASSDEVEKRLGDLVELFHKGGLSLNELLSIGSVLDRKGFNGTNMLVRLGITELYIEQIRG